MNLNQSVAVVTGASGGIGQAVARELRSQGAKLVRHLRPAAACPRAGQSTGRRTRRPADLGPRPSAQTKEIIMSNSSKGTALITGASMGIGAAYADRLAKRGYDLILVARSQPKLQALASQIREETGRAVSVLTADLNNPADLSAVEHRLKQDHSITMLVNNAGVISVAPLLEADVEEMVAMIGLNVTALTRLTYAAAPAFVGRGTGTIINIASVLGISPEILNGVYGASKAYVIALTHSLQHELAGQGLRIQAVLPAATATDLWEKSGLHYDNLPEGTVMTTDDMVDAALIGLDQGEVVTLPSLHDLEQWNRYEAARQIITEHFPNAAPAPRYRVAQLA
jgi:short-subunit dehydrogenase